MSIFSSRVNPPNPRSEGAQLRGLRLGQFAPRTRALFARETIDRLQAHE
ncbi:MAG: hypothetical protein OXC05_00175 [Halieaceae bacterium]|nr:hypothetical protein [Halieaceae bacterium]